MFAILLACFMVIIMPIAVVQYPRVFPPKSRCNERDETGTGENGTGDNTFTATSKSQRTESDDSRVVQSNAEIRTVTSTSQGSVGERKLWDRPQPKDALHDAKGNVFASRSRRSTGMQNDRKPWDPSFPSKPNTWKETFGIRVPDPEPLSTKKRTKMRSKSKATASSSTSNDTRTVLEPLICHVPSTEPLPSLPCPAQLPVPPTPPNPVSTVRASSEPPHEISPPEPLSTIDTRRFSLLRTIAFVLACSIFLLVYAVLIAHCLAWPIIYKTESRLGEVLKGLLSGGDRRVCLCSRY